MNSLALQTDGKLVVGGSFYFSGSPSKAGLCRVSAAGVLDATFNGITNGAHVAGNTGSFRTVEKIIVLGDGKLLISGSFSAYNNAARGGIARLTRTGGLDAAFVPTSNGDVNAMALQPDGKVIVGGTFTTFNGTALNRIARLSTTGTNDATFNTVGGASGAINDLVFQADGRVVLGGDFGTFQGSADTSPLWRFYAGLVALSGTVQLSAAVNTGIEGTSLVLSATRTGGSAGAISVGYSTVAGTASAADFTSANGNLSWADGGNAAKTITVPITADALPDSGETLLVNLGQPLIGTAILGATQQSAVTITTAFAAWRAVNFSVAELADTNISGDLADPDGDGRNNLTEFALGFAPKTPDAAGSPAGSSVNVSGSNYLALTFRRRTPALDLTYTVQNNDLLGTT